MPELGSDQDIFLPHSISVSMNDDCPECKRLSVDYAQAINLTLRSITSIQLAQNENNPVLISELETLKLPVLEKRRTARLELRRHEATPS